MANPAMAPCGLDCSRCRSFIAAHNPEAARQLAEEWRSGGQAKAEPGWFRCQGCRGERSVRWCEDCQIADCTASRGLHNCSQCEALPCGALTAWAAGDDQHAHALERLKAMRREREHPDRHTGPTDTDGEV